MVVADQPQERSLFCLKASGIPAACSARTALINGSTTAEDGGTDSIHKSKKTKKFNDKEDHTDVSSSSEEDLGDTNSNIQAKKPSRETLPVLSQFNLLFRDTGEMHRQKCLLTTDVNLIRRRTTLGALVLWNTLQYLQHLLEWYQARLGYTNQ